MKWTETLC